MPVGIYEHRPLSETVKRKISQALSGRKLSETHKKRVGNALRGRKMSESDKAHLIGSRHYNWKGSEGKYLSHHVWLHRNFGKALKCVNKNCKNVSTKYEYALIHGKEYDHKRENYMTLCVSCHRNYDKKNIDIVLDAHTAKE